MDKPMLIIKCAHHHLYQIAYPCDTKPADFELRSDYQLAEPSGHSHRYNAIVELSFDSLGQPMAIEVTFLSEEHEPQQEQEPLQERPNDPLLQHLLRLHKLGQLSPNVSSSFGFKE